MLAFLYWLAAPSSTLQVALPGVDDEFVLRVGKISTGANRYSFPLKVRYLDAAGLKNLRRGAYEEGIKIYGESLKIKPKNPRALTSRGTAYIALGRLEEARADYENAMMQERRLEAALSKTLSRIYYKRGHKNLRDKKTDAGRKDFTAAIELDPKNALAYQELGSLDILAGRYEDCVKHIDYALQIDQQLKLAYDNRGACYSALGKYPEALEDLNKALLLYPDRAETYGTRAGVQIWLKNYKAAIEDAQKAGELKPELAETLAPLIQMARSQLKK